MIHPQFVTPTAVVEIVTTENYTDITSSPLTFFSNPGASTNSGNIIIIIWKIYIVLFLL